MTGLVFSLEEWQIRLVLPHRPPMLQLDRVTSFASALDRLEAVKAVPGADPMMLRRGSLFTGNLAPGAVIEALAQCCGLLLRLRWLANDGADLTKFAGGDSRQVLDRDIPRSMLAESTARFGRPFAAGQIVRLVARLVLSRGDMHRFEALAKATGPDEAAGSATVGIILNFPPLPPALTRPVTNVEGATC